MIEEEKEQQDFVETGTPREELELPISTHASLVEQDNAIDFHNKITSSISRAALKDSLEDRVKLSYEGQYVDEDEKECLDEDTHADTIKRLRAERLASQRKEAAKNQRMFMQRVAAEKENEIRNASSKIENIFLNKAESKEIEESSHAVVLATPESAEISEAVEESRPTETKSSDTEEIRSVWEDFGCGMCFDSASWAQKQIEQHFPTKDTAKVKNQHDQLSARR